MSQIISTILSIAGSDPSGGAGIQADLKTFSALGFYGSSALTCLTVQNSTGVHQVMPLSASFVEKQIEAVLSDQHVSHIKIGMLGTLEIAQTVCNCIKSFSGEVICDPVMTATTGQALFEPETITSLAKTLLRKVTVLTPNVSELELLTGTHPDTEEKLQVIARDLLTSFPQMKILIVKGGHFNEEEPNITDFLFTQEGSVLKDTRKRHKNAYFHGTGCTYSSAFACYHSLTGDYGLSFVKSGRFLDRLIGMSIGHQVVKSKNNGPLLHHLLD